MSATFARKLRTTTLSRTTPSSSFSCNCSPRPFSTSSLLLQPTPPPAPRTKYELPKGLVLKGIVTNTGKMAHTSTVTVERRVTDHKTLKEFKQHKKFLVHDPEEVCVVGDQVSIRNCRPVSKSKRFELLEILKGARERVENLEGAAAPATATTAA